jgi:hypothetical protein
MQAIYASKLFKASSKERQESIRAAIANPINVELVQQLSEYLDDDYRKKRNEVVQEKEQKKKQETDQISVPDTSENSEGRESSSDRPSFSSAPRHADHHLSNMLKEEESDADVPPVDTDMPETPKTEESSVEESESVSGTPITSSCCPITDPVVALSTQMDSIMGLLNTKDDSAGVRLVSIKGENELWIYYKDSVNLNNVMEPAIALLNAANYPYLNFNSLARTDNAIVFEIDKTKKPVEPIAETDEK